MLPYDLIIVYEQILSGAGWGCGVVQETIQQVDWVLHVSVMIALKTKHPADQMDQSCNLQQQSNTFTSMSWHVLFVQSNSELPGLKA